MTREFIIAQIFDKNWHELGLDDDILQELQAYIIENPGIGNVIEGTGGFR